MYVIKACPPVWGIYNSAGEYILSLTTADNAELVKMILNYDLSFRKPYFNFKNHTSKSKISFENLVNNKI